MKTELNQIFSTGLSIEFKTWKDLTKGRFDKPLNHQKGISYLKPSRGITPVINFHSNPNKEDKLQTPWRDLIFQEEGRVVYNGDNKTSSLEASSTFGNKHVLSILKLYFSSKEEDRLKAVPIIVTSTLDINGKTGFRKFIGFGIIERNPVLVQQYEKKTNKVFSNYQFEVTLFKLDDGEKFNWDWIDDRRDEFISIKESLKRAPKSWKDWVKYGNSVISRNKLRIKSYRIISEEDQSKMPLKNQSVIDSLLTEHYPDPKRDGIRFEALASFITKLYFSSEKYFRGWITKGSGDRGVDYVGRLDIGDDNFSKTSIVVLGQSKRYRGSISGEKLTRVASRMTRGYIGVVVTLSTFTSAAQEEIKDDKLPIILINGKKVSEILLTYINKSGKSLKQIVSEQDEWSKENIGSKHYSTILNL